MRHQTTPRFLCALLLGSLGLSVEACGGHARAGADGDASDNSGNGGRAGASPVASRGGNDAGMPGGLENDETGVGGQPLLPTACSNPFPLLGGVETGIFSCKQGYLHRQTAVECPSRLPRDAAIVLPAGAELAAGAGGVDECSRDSDCSGVNQHCEVATGPQYPCFMPGAISPPTVFSRLCIEGCRVDADCADHGVCVCGENIGTCQAVSAAAGCRTDADCGGNQCLSNARTDNFDFQGSFACQLPGDACSANADCAGGLVFCKMEESGRVCANGPSCGRPFLVEQAPRLASAIETSTWLGVGSPEPHETQAGRGLARRLAEHYTQIGLMEHASVAAFARFTLDLLSLGAPEALVRDASRAQSDEIRHATLAFELAANYGGASVGPGPLDLSDALSRRTMEDILRTTIQEGCVGETRAALEATEASREALPRVKAILEGIAADEQQHAALAWRAVQWMLTARPELLPIAASEFEAALLVTATKNLGSAPERDRSALVHGLVGPARLAELHAEAGREVIAPCARALFAALQAQPAAAPATLQHLMRSTEAARSESISQRS